MREHDSLGSSRRSGGVDDRSQVVFLHPRHPALNEGAVLLQQPLPAVHQLIEGKDLQLPGLHGGILLKQHDRAQARQTCKDWLYGFKDLRVFQKYDRAAGMFKDVAQIFTGRISTAGNVDAADARDPHAAPHPAVPHIGNEADVVSLFHSPAEQAGRNASDLFVHRAESQVTEVGGFLMRGTLDIFKRIKGLEQDLEKANAELRAYANELEDRVALRTEEIRRKQEQIDFELKLAAGLQRSMFAPVSDAHPARVSVSYRPCSAVSGDIYDLGSGGQNQLYFFVGDISGHGVPAALVGAMCTMALDRLDPGSTRPGQVLAHMNRDIENMAGTHYLTAIFIEVDCLRRTMSYASGGHVPGLLLTPAGKLQRLEPTGGIIGVGVDDAFADRRLRYPAGTRLVLYTDGLTEHKNPERDEFGEDRLVGLLRKTRGEAPEVVTGVLEEELTRFGPGTLQDDLTILVVDLP